VPDQAGTRAAARILEMVRGLGPTDLVLCLISAAARRCWRCRRPASPSTTRRAVTKELLRSGANIAEMNCLRKHLSAIKGGRLARRGTGPRGDPRHIGCARRRPRRHRLGTTVPDPTTFADARAILAKYRIEPAGGGGGAPRRATENLRSPAIPPSPAPST